MIRAAAIAYAVIFSLLLGLLASAFIWIASAQKKIEIISGNKERVLFDSYSAIQYGMHTLNENQTETTFYHTSGDTSQLKLIPWGAFTIIQTHTFKGNYQKDRTALVGVRTETALPVLYLANSNEVLKIGGNSKIEGRVNVPNGKVERAYITGQNFTGDKLIEGEIETSERYLPPLHALWKDLKWQNLYSSELIKSEYSKKDSTYSFLNKTTLYKSIEAISISEKHHGNVIFHSYDSIFVSAQANLQHVILIAPVIHFEQGFKGAVQAIASERITCEEKVQLIYPSILVLNEQKEKQNNQNRKIHLKQGAEVRGGILMTTQSFDFRKPIYLRLDPESKVAGLVYNTGETEIKGQLIGSLFTQKLLTHSGGGVYGNHLINAQLSSLKVPRFFIFPDWFELSEGKTSKIIQWL